MEARDLLRTVQFPGDSDCAFLLAVAGARRRKEIVREGGENIRIAAAIEIQRIWRGYRTRSKLKAILSSHGSILDHKLSSEYQTWIIREYMSPSLVRRREVSARIIQKWWREIRRKIKRQKLYSNVDFAATVIQKFWRRYSDIKVFQFYRELINFHSKGNPEVMLKTVNPSEAKLMDKASGGFVRFRLGGTAFPPNVYYKIFTHRPVVDMCAFSPRDYTAMSEKMRLPRDVHNKQPRITGLDTEGWYRRIENNGWRLASTRLENGSMMQDAVTSATKQTTFHHLRVKRREEIERMKKQKRRDWMKKLYTGKLTQSDGFSDETLSESMQEKQGKAEIDTLLEWSTSLDYDRYMSEWQMLATSRVSDDPYTLRYYHQETMK